MKVYLANKMTGVPQMNFPWFDMAADFLRRQGFEVVSPAELDDPEVRAAALASEDGALGSASPNGETWGDFLARDVKIIADAEIDAIVVGPQWNESRGARPSGTRPTRSRRPGTPADSSSRTGTG